MEAFGIIKLMQTYAKTQNKWCMYIHTSYDDFNEIIKAAPYLKETDKYGSAYDCIVLTFDTEKEMEKYYDLTVGDDGPTKHNSYDGECRVYALTCSNTGELLTENT